MPAVINRYLASFDEIHMGTVRYTEAIMADTQMSEKEKKDAVCDYLLDFFIMAYLLGTDTGKDYLGFEMKPEMMLMMATIEKKIEGKTFRDRVADHLKEESPERMAQLAESEFHRVFNAAEMDTARAYEKSTGRPVYKTWRTVGDDRVRQTHDYIEGVKIPLNEYYHTFDGDTALQPGGFKSAENNAGCRCWLTLSATEKS